MLNLENPALFRICNVAPAPHWARLHWGGEGSPSPYIRRGSIRAGEGEPSPLAVLGKILPGRSLFTKEAMANVFSSPTQAPAAKGPQALRLPAPTDVVHACCALLLSGTA